MTRYLTLANARENFAGMLLAFVEGLTDYYQLDATAAAYQKARSR